MNKHYSHIHNLTHLVSDASPVEPPLELELEQLPSSGLAGPAGEPPPLDDDMASMEDGRLLRELDSDDEVTRSCW